MPAIAFQIFRTTNSDKLCTAAYKRTPLRCIRAPREFIEPRGIGVILIFCNSYRAATGNSKYALLTRPAIVTEMTAGPEALDGPGDGPNVKADLWP